MDLRVRKTKKSIALAFWELRKEKSIDKITVKELAQKATINKATFYLHYHDIYDLEKKLQTYSINLIINSVRIKNVNLLNYGNLHKELMLSFAKYANYITIFTDSDNCTSFIAEFESTLIDYIRKFDNNFATDPNRRLLLSFIINGSFYTYINNKDIDNVVEKINTVIIEALSSSIERGN